MKRLTRKILGAALAIALSATAIAVVVWISATTQGTRWLLTSVVPLSGVGFSAQRIEGNISEHLLLTGVRVSLPHQIMDFDSLELRWKPLLLLAGTVGIQELTLNGVHIQDNAPPDNKPLVLAWPRVPKSVQLLDASIARLRVTNLSYRRLQQQPFQIASITSSVTWQDDLLSISKLTAESPSANINGTISAGFKQPSLITNLAIATARPLAEMDRFSLQIKQSRGRGPETFAGMLSIVGNAGPRKVLELNGDVGMAQKALNLRQVRLTRPCQKGLVTADGSLAFATLESILSLQVKVEDLDLAPELNVPTNLSGTLSFVGTPGSYRGNFTLANQAKGWQAAVVSAIYHGTGEGMKLSTITGSILDGSLAGNLDMDWRNGFTMQGAISGRNLNPARIAPDWKGVANFNANGKLAWSGKSPVMGSISGTLLESRLHGQALTGEVKANIADNNLSLNRLALQGKGFDLQASGELNQRLAVTARISDFSRLVPGSTGTLQTEGWVRWRDGQPSGAFAGTGSKLAYGGAQIATASFTARIDQGPDYPGHVTAALRDVIYDGYKLNAASLSADGTLPRHTVSATLRSSGSEAGLAVSAGYKSGTWKGSITRLSGRDSNGPWNMAAPAAFAVSAEKVSLSPLALTAGTAERLEMAADLALNPLNGQVSAQWADLNLARANPYLQDMLLKGRISGQTKGIMLPGRRFELDGNAVLSDGTLHQENPDGELNLAFSSATTSWGWRGETLAGNLSLTMAEHGKAHSNFQLPIPARFPVAVNQKAPLRATVSGQFQEKGIITTLFPGLIQESSGEFDVDLAINGTWETPLIGGKLKLAKAGAYLPTAGIRLQDVQLAARLEKDLIRIDSFRAVSGPGHLEGTALLTLSRWRVSGYQGTIRGENFQTVNTPELRILSTPKLSFEGSPQKLTLRGELRLPELQIVGAQSRSVILPSNDVILEGRVLPAAKASPLALDVQIQVLLGEKAFVKVSGIDAQLGGTMDLSLSNLQRITSKGEIKVVKGYYRTYGVNLEIVRGRLFFAGGTVDNPSLDFLALRTIGNVRAGVTVAGTLQKPVTKLYSEPAMPDVDVLAYIVLGHPLGSSGQQASLMTQAAGALLTSGQAAVLQEQLKNYLGLSTLEIQSGVGGTPSSMGYKPLQVTPPGAIPASPQPGITETVLTVGKYLTPQLYFSYGRSLFTGSNLFRLRYDISKRWQIETQTGSESGADLFYKLEFK